MGVNLTPEQAIALAEILPESPCLAHVNILENPEIMSLAEAQGEAAQEEACALYASLMAAARVSSSICCIDVEVPNAASSEVVKALARQVVAYCLYNMERPVAELNAQSDVSLDKEIIVPDILLDLVGHVEGSKQNHDAAAPAPDDDYVIGGTGVVKALDICLKNKGNDVRPLSSRQSQSSEWSEAGLLNSRAPMPAKKAKDMSKNLLGSARKMRERLHPALQRASKDGHTSLNYRKLCINLG